MALTRKRWPSREAAYHELLLLSRSGSGGSVKSTDGVPASNCVADAVIGTAIKRPSGVPMYISRPSFRHMGDRPPAVETCVLCPRPGKDCTYTSKRPLSLDSYATQRPSGETRARASSAFVAA